MGEREEGTGRGLPGNRTNADELALPCGAVPTPHRATWWTEGPSYLE